MDINVYLIISDDDNEPIPTIILENNPFLSSNNIIPVSRNEGQLLINSTKDLLLASRDILLSIQNACLDDVFDNTVSEINNVNIKLNDMISKLNNVKDRVGVLEKELTIKYINPKGMHEKSKIIVTWDKLVDIIRNKAIYILDKYINDKKASSFDLTIFEFKLNDLTESTQKFTIGFSTLDLDIDIIPEIMRNDISYNEKINLIGLEYDGDYMSLEDFNK